LDSVIVLCYYLFIYLFIYLFFSIINVSGRMMLLRLIFLVLATAAFGRKINDGVQLLLNQFDTIKELGKQLLDDTSPLVPSPLFPDYDFWKFIPQFEARLIPGGSTATWASPCFGKNVGSAVLSDDNKSIKVNIVSSKAQQLTSCYDSYMSGFVAHLNIKNRVTSNKLNEVTTTYTIPIPDDVTSSELWDLNTKGVRILRYFVPGFEAYSSLLSTIELFGGEFFQAVPPAVAKKNIDFLAKYAKVQVNPRDPSLNFVPDENEVKSGDAFYIMRLDGLNPMLAWAMGSTTGHVTTALWIDGQLYVCESTTESSYWPTDYIQKTPYRTWIQQTQAADMQVVWAPLSDAARKTYNETAAVEFFKANEGFNYGFQAMLWAWIDTAKGNFPCLPPDYSTNCLGWEVLELLVSVVDRHIHQIGDLMWNSAMARRLNLPDGLRTSDLWYQASLQGLTSIELAEKPELDTYLYNTTRYDEPAVGKAMVCCVLVCNMWKAAGMFGELSDQINCGEQTNYDDYALTIHAESYRQIVGSYSLELVDFRTQDFYAHMHENCAALPPTYERAPGC
jgi:hypothetical protein